MCNGHNRLTKWVEMKVCLNIVAICGSNSDWDNSHILRHVPVRAIMIGEIYICFKREQLREQTRKGMSHSPAVCASCTAVAMHTRARAARRGSAMALVADYCRQRRGREIYIFCRLTEELDRK